MDPGQLKNIDDDERNVVLLVHCSGPPLLEFGEHLTRQLGGGLQAVIAYDAFELPVAKCLPRRVLRFGHAVSVEQAAIGWFKRHAAHRIRRVRFDSPSNPLRMSVTPAAR